MVFSNLRWLSTAITCVLISSSFYTTSFGISPIYLVFPICLLLLVLISDKKRRFSFNYEVFLFILITVPFLYKSIYTANEYTNPILVNMVLGLIGFFIVISINLKGLEPYYDKVTNVYSGFVVTITGLDTIFRYLKPVYNPIYLAEGSDSWFYQYKHSYILGDSNLVALLIINALFFRMSIKTLQNKKVMDYWFLVFTLLLIFTISRSAYLATIVGVIYVALKEVRYKKVIYLSSILMLLPVMLVFLDFVINDKSGGTKLREFSALVKFFNESSLIDIIFGIGFGHGNEISGRYIHSLLVKLLMEGGGILFLLIGGACCFLIIINSSIIYYLLPLLISSFSLSFYIFAPFQMVTIALLINISRNCNSLGEQYAAIK